MYISVLCVFIYFWVYFVFGFLDFKNLKIIYVKIFIFFVVVVGDLN